MNPRDGAKLDVCPNLSLDERSAVLGEVIQQVIISPILQRELPWFDPDRVEVAPSASCSDAIGPLGVSAAAPRTQR